MKPPKFLIAIATSVALVLPAFAEDHEEDEDHQRRTKSEIRAFLEKHFPEPLEHMQHAREEEDEEALEEFWHEAGKFVGEFYHIREGLGGQASEHYLHLRRSEFMADRLTEKIHETDNEGHAEELKAKLREVIGAHVEHRLHFERAELERAKRELEEAARHLEEAVAHHQELVEEELHKRLHGEHPEDEDEDHGERDDEVEDRDEAKDEDDDENEEGDEDVEDEGEDDDQGEDGASQ